MLDETVKIPSKVFVVQSLSCVRLLTTPRTAAHKASQSFTISWSFLKLISIETVILSDRLILYRPLILWPSIFPSIKVFCNELALRIRWPKYWNFSISPSSEVLISYMWILSYVPRHGGFISLQYFLLYLVHLLQ